MSVEVGESIWNLKTNKVNSWISAKTRVNTRDIHNLLLVVTDLCKRLRKVEEISESQLCPTTEPFVSPSVCPALRGQYSSNPPSLKVSLEKELTSLSFNPSSLKVPVDDKEPTSLCFNPSLKVSLDKEEPTSLGFDSSLEVSLDKEEMVKCKKKQFSKASKVLKAPKSLDYTSGKLQKELQHISDLFGKSVTFYNNDEVKYLMKDSESAGNDPQKVAMPSPAPFGNITQNNESAYDSPRIENETSEGKQGADDRTYDKRVLGGKFCMWDCIKDSLLVQSSSQVLSQASTDPWMAAEMEQMYLVPDSEDENKSYGNEADITDNDNEYYGIFDSPRGEKETPEVEKAGGKSFDKRIQGGRPSDCVTENIGDDSGGGAFEWKQETTRSKAAAIHAGDASSKDSLDLNLKLERLTLLEEYDNFDAFGVPWHWDLDCAAVTQGRTFDCAIGCRATRFAPRRTLASAACKGFLQSLQKSDVKGLQTSFSKIMEITHSQSKAADISEILHDVVTKVWPIKDSIRHAELIGLIHESLFEETIE